MKVVVRFVLLAPVLLGLGGCLSFLGLGLGGDSVPPAERQLPSSAQALLAIKGMKQESPIFVRIFKEERILELWARPADKDTFELIKEYPICDLSGELGPKRKQGDLQAPEGFYYIDRFNPASQFHLSLGINYPNESDRILGEKGNLGGDIFIHGSCVTIGCFPITDDKIKELYIVAIEAKNNGQNKIPVHIFPRRLDENGMKELTERYQTLTDLLKFWQGLKRGYDYFEKKHQLPLIKINKNGDYIIPE